MSEAIPPAEERRTSVTRRGFQFHKNFLSDIKKYRNISTLERGLLVRLVDKIYVLEEKRIEIHFNYDETTDILDKLSDYTKQSSELMKEVV